MPRKLAHSSRLYFSLLLQSPKRRSHPNIADVEEKLAQAHISTTLNRNRYLRRPHLLRLNPDSTKADGRRATKKSEFRHFCRACYYSSPAQINGRDRSSGRDPIFRKDWDATNEIL